MLTRPPSLPAVGACLWIAAGLAVVGCGGDSAATATDASPDTADGGPDATDAGPAAACGMVQPCGGALLGDWMFGEVCESSSRIAASAASFSTMAAGSWCPIQTLVGIAPQVSGSLRFDAAGTYSLALVFGGSIDVNYPASCLAGLSCDDATAGFQSQIDAGTYPTANATSISCAGSSSCRCRVALNGPQSETGTYSISGSALTFAATGGAVTNKSYCVAGNALHILDISMGSMGQTDVDSDLVAMKQQ